MSLTTGSGYAAQGESPYFLRPDRVPEFTSAAEADSIVRADIRAGLSFRDILRALTAAPTTRLGGGKLSGALQRGRVADITVLAGDPPRGVGAFPGVRAAIGRAPVR